MNDDDIRQAEAIRRVRNELFSLAAHTLRNATPIVFITTNDESYIRRRIDEVLIGLPRSAWSEADKAKLARIKSKAIRGTGYDDEKELVDIVRVERGKDLDLNEIIKFLPTPVAIFDLVPDDDTD